MTNSEKLNALACVTGGATVATGVAAWFATGSATVTVAVAAAVWAVFFTLTVRHGTEG